MSLADRLKSVDARPGRNGCGTCNWVAALSDEDGAAWREWVSSGRSMVQLWQLCVDESEYPLSLEAMRVCIRMHHR